MKNLLLFFAAFSILFTSCKQKDEDINPIDASKVKLLMDGYWKLTNYTVLSDVSDPNSLPMDNFNPLPGCVKDDFFEFASSDIFIQHEGATKCTPNLPDSREFYFELTEDENRLVVWSNPDDRLNSLVYDAKITYPSLTKFILVYRTYSKATELTSEHIKTFQKLD